jgi:hypothetical protein
MIKLGCIICLLTFWFQTSAQNGFIGKKNLIEVSGMGNVPFLSGAFSDTNFINAGDKMKGRKDWFDYGFSVQYSRILSSKVAFGIHSIFRSFDVFTDRSYDSDFYGALIGSYERTTNYRMESVQILSFSHIPTIMISPKGSIQGVGLVHEFGVGYSNYIIRNKAYYYSLNEFDENEETWSPVDTHHLAAEWPSTHSLVMKYGMHLQVPLSHSIHLKMGTTSMIHIYYKPDFNSIVDNQLNLFNYENIFYNVRRENLVTWNLQCGVVFVL